ncbi:putative cell wall-binding protein [Microbacteriaceae bacterium SG_E_30_P1]|uniref:Cell wall-binding protein n=1 Tax=Antiquaquibacter oligotrophicus TaxID=2880260 RepID=A0ABT6KLL0_9MICO|nr:cell wall-binding repeat-containing protein [Antiquaquibacter oligotrophicus]MDH6180017.1 putative cell wall-binding protein [Antiquaquibacter oligotrophicus]UDF14229.1 cell wall-binding repeat-containing protein [Antiquaquibacter oligotrophicus]
MQTRVLAGVGSVALIASLLVVGSPAAADIAPPALPISRPDAGITFPTQYPTKNTLQVFPDLASDASNLRGVRPYDEIAPLLNSLQAGSDVISAQVVGKTDLRNADIPNGRDIYLVTLTSPETPEETAQQLAWRDMVKHDPTAAALDEELQAEYKVPIWFNGNIHGNEWEGTDATLNYIQELVNNASQPAVQELLSTTRLYFTVTNNPDGRALGQREQALGYDPNRDAVTGATAEASIIRDLSSLIQPTYFVDLHGYTNVLQVEPCGPPHGENYEYDLFIPHAYSAALAVEQAVTAANIPGNTYMSPTGGTTTTNTGKINIPYRDQREGWDDWPPIFAPQYVAYQGAITNTVELPLGRLTLNSTNQAANAARAAINIQVADVVIKTIVDYVTDHKAALLDNQMEIFRRGIAGEPSVEIPADIAVEDLEPDVPTEWVSIWDETDVYVADYPRAYVLPQGGTQRSDTDAQRLVQSLLVHGIEVDQASAPFSAGGKDYAAGSYIVDMHQPLRGLANVLLDDGTDISARVGDMYDISAWSLALLWGADVDSIGTTGDELFTFEGSDVSAVDPSGTVPAPGTYLTFEPRGAAEWQAVNALLAEGIALEQLEDEKIILGPDAASYSAALEVADVFGVDFTASSGSELRDGTSKPLKSLKIAYTGGNIDRDMLTKMGFKDFVSINGTAVNNGTVDLSTIDLLWLGSALSGLNTTGTANINAYLAAGKPALGRGTAISSFANTFGIVTAGASSASSSSNGIVSLTVNPDGVLSQWSQDTAFVYPAVRYTGLGSNAVIESTYAATTESMMISGWWPEANRTAFVGQPAAVSAVGPTGSKTYFFGTSVLFRNHPVGAFSDIARAMYWGATAGTNALPVPPLVDRIEGANRYDVAVNISTEAFPETAPVVYVATGINYPDALSAGPAAAHEGGPVLLVPGTSIPASVSAEIARLDPERIVVVGGPASVAPAVFNELTTMADTVERIEGANRYEVSRNLASEVFGTAERAYLATGANFPDALAAGAVGGNIGAPVVLVNGTQPTLDSDTATLLNGLGVTSLRVAGGPNSVSSGILDAANVIAPTTRLDGADRYAAARSINADAYTEADRVFLATGLNFPDALAGSVLAALNEAPLFVVKTACVDQATLDAIESLGADHITLLGGPNSLNPSIEALTPCV